MRLSPGFFCTAILALGASLTSCARSSEPAADRVSSGPGPQVSARAPGAAGTTGTTGTAARPSAPSTAVAPPASATTFPLGKHWLGQLPPKTTQLVLVTSPSWEAHSASLERHTLTASGWRRVGTPAQVVLGKSGLGWGRGVHQAEADGPHKAEGDGRAPAGLFLIQRSFGHGPGAELKTALDHRAVGPSWRCVDDPRSSHYTEVLDSAALPRGETADWKSAERMQRSDALYEIVIWADHNRAPPLAGAGSCIFLHTWRLQDAAPRPTVGCTAMPRAALLELAAWLEPGAILAQLPEPQLGRD